MCVCIYVCGLCVCVLLLLIFEFGFFFRQVLVCSLAHLKLIAPLVAFRELGLQSFSIILSLIFDNCKRNLGYLQNAYVAQISTAVC